MDRQTVRRALDIARGPAEREYFFSQLKSPEWLRPLEEEGVFREVPDVVRGDSYVQFPRWPAMEYLARIAAALPAEAGRILLALPYTDNQRVHVDLAQIALAVNVDVAAQWAGKEQGWVKTQQTLFFSLPEKLMSVAARLVDEKHLSAALDLLAAVLEPLPKHPDPALKDIAARRDASSRCDRWEYSEAVKVVLPRLVQREPVTALAVFSGLLARAISITTDPEDLTRSWDGSSIWRDTIEHDEAAEDIRDVLISATRDSAVSAATIQGCEEVSAYLLAQRWDVFRRIAMHVVRVACKDSVALLEECLTSQSNFGDPAVHHEYAMLLADGFGQIGTEARTTILSWISAGPDRESMRRRFREFEGAELPAELEEAWVEQWQRDRLSPMSASLPMEWQELFKQYVARHGRPEFDFVQHRVTVGFRGDPSPIGIDEATSMGGEALVRYLRERGRAHDPSEPHSQGLLATLRSLPWDFYDSELSRAPSDWSDLPARYSAVVIEKLRDRVGGGHQPHWPSVFALLSSLTLGGDEDWDSKWLRRVVADLLEAAFNSTTATLPIEYRWDAWAVLTNLLHQVSATEGTNVDGDTVDALTRAINSAEGRTLEAVVRYAVWVKHATAGADDQWRLDASAPEVARALSEWASSETVPLYTRAVFGAQLTPLLWLDAAWVRSQSEHLIPLDAEHRSEFETVWYAYVRFGHPYTKAFETFRSAYLSHLNSVLEGDESAVKTSNHVAEHLLVYYAHGLLNPSDGDSLFELAFRRSPAQFRSHIVDFAGRTLRKADDPPADFLARLAALLDQFIAWVGEIRDVEERRQEAQILVPFGWWVGSDCFDPEWTLTRLISVLRHAGEVEPESIAADALEKMVDRYPLSVADSLYLMVTRPREYYTVGAIRDHVRQVVEKLLARSEPELHARAHGLINAMVERQVDDLRYLVPRRVDS